MFTVNDVGDFQKETNIYKMMWKLSKPTDQRITKPLADDFCAAPSDLPKWTRAHDFSEPIHLPCGEVITGFRFLNFADCTNTYVVNDKGESFSEGKLSRNDIAYLYNAMEAYAMGKLRRKGASKTYRKICKASAGQGSNHLKK